MRTRTTKQLVNLMVFIAIGVVLFVVRLHTSQQPHTSTNTTTQSNQQAKGQYAGATAPELTNAQCHMHGVLPDSICTPGAVNPDVTQATIGQTICEPGYTKTVRPPVTYTDHLKAQQMSAYGFTDSISSHEEDHLIPLELGGAPSDPKNLWPEPQASPNAKDKVEDFMNTEVCEDKISLQDAQKRIATNWTTAEQGL